MGGCLCGTVRYRVTSDPIRVVHCHCRFCQRSTGGAGALEAFFPAESVSIAFGEPSTYAHRSQGSGKLLELLFCSKCGTKILATMERYPGIVAALVGTFDDPEWFEPVQDRRYVFLSSARSGTVIPPGVPTFAEGSVQLSGAMNPTKVFDDFHVIAHT